MSMIVFFRVLQGFRCLHHRKGQGRKMGHLWKWRISRDEKKPSRNFGRAGRFPDSLGREVPSEGVGGENGGAHVLR